MAEAFYISCELKIGFWS